MTTTGIVTNRSRRWGATLSVIFGVLSATVAFLVTYGGYPFEYPRLFTPIAIVLAAALTLSFYMHCRDRWNREFRAAVWMRVIGFFAAAFVASLTLAWVADRVLLLPPSFANGEIGILVAELPEQKNHAQQMTYERALIDRFRDIQSLRNVAKVSLIARPLPFDLAEQQAEALKIGRWLRASFVLRPFAVEGVQEPRLTVVNHLEFFNPESRIGGKFEDKQLANLDQLELPNDVALLAETMLAFVFAERQSYDKAAQILDDVLRSPNLPDAVPSRWELNFLRGNVSGNTTEAIAEYREAIRLNPNLAEAHSNLGVALDAEGHYDDAIAEYRDAIRLKPDYAEAYSNLGSTLEHKGQYDAAIAEYREAIRLKPDLAEAHTNLGNALYDKGQYDAAVAEHKEAIRLKPGFVGAHDNLGNALDHKGQYDAAIAEHKEAIRLKPDFAKAYDNLGSTLEHKGQYDAAIAEYKEAIRLKPDFAVAHSNLGAAFEAKGQYDAAIAEYKEAIRLKPDFAEAHTNLGSTLEDKGLYDAAIAEHKEAIRLKPNLAESRSNLCNVLNLTGQYDAAIATCKEAIRLNPNLAMAHHNLGVALKRTGQSAQATREFTEAHHLDPKITPLN